MNADRCPRCRNYPEAHELTTDGRLVCGEWLGTERCHEHGWQIVTDRETTSTITGTEARIGEHVDLACGCSKTKDIRQDHV